MEDFTKKELFDELSSLKKWNKQILQQVQDFRKLGEHTVDVDIRMQKTESLAKRAKEDVFTVWKMWRFKRKRAHPLVLKSMQIIGKEMSGHFLDCGQAWKYPDSQRIREEHPELFRKREVIEGHIRDNLFTLKDMRGIAQEHESRYGSHEYLTSDRAFKWVQVFVGFILGVASSLLVLLISQILGWKQ
ncbi:hypothetical protein I8H84_02685 [Candidatus Saccharibacteria bacterium]|nr:hypothetical protein [Candidatus Saccharibacteria bacterium]MBH1972850.1 hypothetical protein [Candidatus Saccharibacteria bacterium]MBH1991051.1 hypothetical protein [Candidatus Saccharibacteria bacterium]